MTSLATNLATLNAAIVNADTAAANSGVLVIDIENNITLAAEGLKQRSDPHRIPADTFSHRQASDTRAR